MLLRWIINNYLREAAAGKVRELVGDALPPSSKTRSLWETVAAKQPGERPAIHSVGEASPPQPPAPAVDHSSAPSPDEFVPCDIAFVFALGIESGGLVDCLTDAETSRLPHGVERAGKLGRREVVIVESGVGVKAAARATAEAIAFYKPRWVVSAGFAGALEDQLRRGHILLADEVANLAHHRLAVGLKLDPASRETAKGLHVGRLLTVDEIVRQPATRRRLAAEHGALACDMETFAAAQTCHQHGVRLLAVRIITDAVDDELPPEIEHLLAQKSLAGKLGAATGAILRRFSAAKDLWRLREEALKASDRLARFLVGLIEQLD